MTTPFVSVLLDNYNYAKYLPETLDSVLSQTYRNFELVIVDDGSTDRSREIIQYFVAEHGDGFPIKTVFKENGGQTSAFNAGFEQCAGDIVCFLDSDDMWFPEKLERAVRAHMGALTDVSPGTLTNVASATCNISVLDNHKNMIVNHIVHHVETIDPGSNPAGFDFQTSAEPPKPYSRVLTGIDWHPVLMQHGYMCHHSSCSSMSYSREILARIFPLIAPEDMRFCSDTVVFTCCLSLAPMYKLDEVLSYYRMHGSNIYAGQYSGERDMELTLKIREYCNRQLAAKNLPVIDFHPSRYFEHICDNILPKSVNTTCIALYGTASAGIAFYNILSEKGYDICCFIDSNPAKQGIEFMGKQVIAPEQWKAFKTKPRKPLILITSWASRDISERLHSIGLVRDEDFIILPI